MQTFLPYPEFDRCARVLDDKRLGKQIVECYQILKAITDPIYGWQHHPAVNQWRGYEDALMDYAYDCSSEWSFRNPGKVHGAWVNMVRYFESTPRTTLYFVGSELPLWLGDERLHSSHRSNLLRKDPGHYGQFGWTETPDFPYFWPSKAPEYQVQA